jgi:hypothetical protein
MKMQCMMFCAYSQVKFCSGFRCWINSVQLTKIHDILKNVFLDLNLMSVLLQREGDSYAMV